MVLLLFLYSQLAEASKSLQPPGRQAPSRFLLRPALSELGPVRTLCLWYAARSQNWPGRTIASYGHLSTQNTRFAANLQAKLAHSAPKFSLELHLSINPLQDCLAKSALVGNSGVRSSKWNVIMVELFIVLVQPEVTDCSLL
jgi:hypothetical protein